MNECPLCLNRDTPQIFHGTVAGRRHLIAVKLAKQLIADGREPIVLSRDELTHFANRQQFDDSHVAHVNNEPGIVGVIDSHFILIDGIHRAVRALRSGKPFLAYALTAEETAACEKQPRHNAV